MKETRNIGHTIACTHPLCLLAYTEHTEYHYSTLQHARPRRAVFRRIHTKQCESRYVTREN